MSALYTRDSTTEEPQDSPDSPTTLEDIIEEERTRLLTAGTVLGCASVAIENDRSADRHAFYYADVIELARSMILQTTVRLDSVCLESFYEQLRKARRDLSRIEADALSGMTIATAGHRQPLLTINTGTAQCGDISDGVSLVHHSGISAEGWLVNSEGWWVMSFADLEAIYQSAVAKRAAKHN
jgi:hypothetical protein